MTADFTLDIILKVEESDMQILREMYQLKTKEEEKEFLTSRWPNVSEEEQKRYKMKASEAQRKLYDQYGIDSTVGMAFGGLRGCDGVDGESCEYHLSTRSQISRKAAKIDYAEQAV